MTEPLRYSDLELEQFKKTILDKLEKARIEVRELRDLLIDFFENSHNDPPANLEDGSDSEVREHYSEMIARQKKFIQNLENALVRIQNKSYGICRVTGKLISKQRLMAVPHATLCIEAKLNPQAPDTTETAE